MFRINKEGTELYSKGGCNPKFSKFGKVWSSKGALKLHLRQFIVDNKNTKRWENNIPRNWFVVTLEQIELSKGQWAYVENKDYAYTFYPVGNPYVQNTVKEDEYFLRTYPLTFDNFDRRFSDIIKVLPMDEKTKLILINRLSRFIFRDLIFNKKNERKQN